MTKLKFLFAILRKAIKTVLRNEILGVDGITDDEELQEIRFTENRLRFIYSFKLIMVLFYFNTCTVHNLLFYKITNKSTITINL